MFIGVHYHLNTETNLFLGQFLIKYFLVSLNTIRYVPTIGANIHT